MGASVAGTAGANGGGVGFPSHSSVTTARDDIFRRMIVSIGGGPLASVTGNTVPQTLLDGAASKIIIPSNFCDFSERGILCGGVRSRLVFGIKNSSGAGRTLTFHVTPITATLPQIFNLPSLASDSTEYLLTMESTVYVIGGAAKNVGNYFHDLLVWNGGGSTPIGGTGTATQIRSALFGAGDMSVNQTPLYTVNADIVSAACLINLYAVIIETFASQATFGV